MTQPAKVQEPSMEEILASIRRIISEEDKPAEAGGGHPAERGVVEVRDLGEGRRAVQRQGAEFPGNQRRPAGDAPGEVCHRRPGRTQPIGSESL